jgi:hypothetical protein
VSEAAPGPQGPHGRPGSDQNGPMGSDDRAERQSRLVSMEAASIAGLVFAVLSFTSVTMLARLPSASDASEIAAFYGSDHERRLDFIALTLAVFSAIAFLWFLAVVRRRVGDREDRFFATVFFGSGVVYITLMLIGSAVLTGPSLAIDRADGIAPDQSVYSLMVGIGYGLLLSVVPRIQAIFIITTSTLVLRTGILSRWVAIVGYVIAALMLAVPFLTRPSGVGLPVWVGLMSLVLLLRNEGIGVDPDRRHPS